MESIEELREKTVKKLEYNYAHGEISLDELEKRMEKAVNANQREDLEVLASDLINPQSEQSREVYGDDESEETIVGFLSGINRKGKWKPARRIKVLVFMGGVDLDFAMADLLPGTTEIEFFCAMGGIDIRVPEGINVDLSGLPLLGGIENKLSGEFHPGNPTIKVHGTVIMGGLDVKPSKKKKKKR